jgi:hypothetical protein
VRDTWLGRVIRRVGRVAIGLVAFVAGCAAFVTISFVNLLVTRHYFAKVCGVIGLGTAVMVFALFDRLGLVPDDPDPATTLSLNDYSAGSDQGVHHRRQR